MSVVSTSSTSGQDRPPGWSRQARLAGKLDQRGSAERVAQQRDSLQHVVLDGGLVDGQVAEGAGAGLELEQGEQDVLGPDVVVAQPECLSERKLQRLGRRAAVRHQRWWLGQTVR